MSTLVALGGVAVASLYLISAGIAVHRGNHPGVRSFIVFVVLFAIAAGFSGVRLAVGGLPPVLVLAPILIFAIYAWVVVVFEYTGRGPILTPRLLLGIIGFAVLTVASPLLTAWVGGRQPVLTLLNQITQTLMIGGLTYAALLVGVSARQYDELSTGGVLILSVSGLGLILYSVVRFAGEADVLAATTELNGMVVLLGGLGLSFLGIQHRYRPFDGDPSTGYLAREAALDWINDAILIGDREDRLFDFNDTAEALFVSGGTQPFGRPIQDILGTEPTHPDESSISLDTRIGRRQFDVHQLSLTDGRGNHIGRAYRLRDVTDRQTHQERLDVVNRVLRHNFRNGLDAIQAFAEALERGSDRRGTNESDEYTNRLRTVANDLTTLCDKVGRIEQLLAHDIVETEAVDVVQNVRTLVDEVHEETTATVTVQTEGHPVRVRTNERFLRVALQELLDNAVEHNEHDAPQVTVAIRQDGTGVRIDVIDNGPGIPDQEREILLTGESALRHGSGIGLWIVHWTVRRLGGTVTFAENDPRGSVVTLSFPALESTG